MRAPKAFSQSLFLIFIQAYAVAAFMIWRPGGVSERGGGGGSSVGGGSVGGGNAVEGVNFPKADFMINGLQ